ncbi:MAG: AAA family ATPase, partial [bacterium]
MRMTGDAILELIEALSDPRAYPGSPSRVEVVQTHISVVFLAGDRAYKVKKPVDLGFLDFTTLELRRRCCEEEVRLNRRLAPEIYLGVVPVVRDRTGRMRVGGEGEPVEWAVEMIRLPEERMLYAMLDRGEIDSDLVNGLADLLARFHAEAAT